MRGRDIPVGSIGAGRISVRIEAQVRAVQFTEHEVHHDAKAVGVRRGARHIGVLAADGIPVAIAQPLVVEVVPHRPPGQIERGPEMRGAIHLLLSGEGIGGLLALGRDARGLAAGKPDDLVAFLQPAGLRTGLGRQQLGLQFLGDLDRIRAPLAVDGGLEGQFL